MTDVTPNPKQEELIENTEGTYVVDAGAGTGKTFAITRRYARILERDGVEPEDVLLVTFTRNAAGEMADRIAQRSPYDPVQLQDAPINTFHGHCFQLLTRYGHETPTLLGIDDRIPESMDLVEDSVREASEFRTFVGDFADRHPEYDEFLAAIRDPVALRSLVAELAAKGVVPTADGWYRGSDEPLRGDRDAFFELFDRANEPNEGAYGPNNSDTLSGVGSWDETGYAPDAPSPDEVVDGKQLRRDVVARAFDEDRDRLFAFVHDVYIEYVRYALQHNYLTQGLMLVLAFVMLCDDPTVRRTVRHEYVMVDEFQDTNELQFKLTLLLAGTNNVCVVGDWKQSIYGFQYTSVDNILEFEARIDSYRAALNRDVTRIPYSVDDVRRITLETNYRSTESILEFAPRALRTPATNSDSVDLDRAVKPLDPHLSVDNSRIEAYTPATDGIGETDGAASENGETDDPDELDLVLDRLQCIVGNDEYAVERHDEPAPTPEMTETERAAAERERLDAPEYEDVAVFTRTRSFARDLIERAAAYDVPLAYEGGVELFDTDQAKLLLAWLRICESDARRGWAVVLEEAGYTLPGAKAILDDKLFPEPMLRFRDRLQETETVGSFARTVFDAYGDEGPFADALLSEIAAVTDDTLATRSEAITAIESNLAAGTTVEVDTNPGGNSATLQTIHGAKGLEYPIVVLANVNSRAFPSFGRPGRGNVQFDDMLGIRTRRVYGEPDGHPYVYDDWRYDLLNGSLPSEYDEERRLLYVAITRAKRHLLFTAGERPSDFFTTLFADPTPVTPVVEHVQRGSETVDSLDVRVPNHQSPRRLSVHDLMDDAVFEAVEGGRGPAFGTRVHDFAEAYADGERVTPSNPDERNVRAFLNALDGELRTEIDAFLPVAFESRNEEDRVIVVGIVDLLVVTDDRVRIVDYKTDLGRHAESEYRTQLSVYYHVVSAVYPERDVTTEVFYTADGERVTVEPLSRGEVRNVVSRS
ncbi:UvrD-helicase domain-containing protein [Halorubrum sp. DTA98]|uniref:UvrD-helicase domain-containing protein n=1 Tax=Halorubrum sp. DTA98 TaxID=3402163 RepID=UPI003AABFADD